jgi:hypothetical protein
MDRGEGKVSGFNLNWSTSILYVFYFCCSDHVDLQLPQISHFQPDLPFFEEEEIPDINFKEKVVKSIAPSARNEPVAFKKRKIQKKNVRQRNDSDDE